MMFDYTDRELEELEEIFGKVEKPNYDDVDWESRKSDQHDYDEMTSKGLENAYLTTGYTENW